MEYIYGVLLLHSAGKEVNEENLKKVLEAADIEVDEARVRSLVSALKGVDIDEVLKQAAVPAAPAAAPVAAPAEEKAEEKKEEEEKEEEEEEAAAGLAALFG